MLISIVALAVLQLVVVGTAEGRRKSNRRTTSVAPRTSTDLNEAPEYAAENVTLLVIDSTIFATEVPGNETFREQAGRILAGEPAESDDPGGPNIHIVTCSRPPLVEGAKIPRARDKEYAIGSTVSYQCDYGYVSDGSTVFHSICVFDEESGEAKWSDPKLNCFPRSCGDPGFVTNARRIGSVFTFPYTVEFECDEGYKLNGIGVRYCQASGVWSGKLPSCEPIYCEQPRHPENGRVRYISLEYGAKLRYECNRGFILSNKQERHCNANGTWSNDDPVCIESNCDEPQAPSHGFMQLTDGLKVGSLVFYTCEEGKSLIGASTSKCLDDGQWTFPSPKCVDQCEVPTAINGKIGKYEMTGRYRDIKKFVSIRRGRKVIPGETVFLLCNQYFASEDVPGAVELEISCKDGNWSGSFKCISDLCNEEPPPIENGYPVVAERTHGKVIYYRCNENYMKGSIGHVECFYGKWRGPTPTCIDGRCYTDDLNFAGLVKPTEESFAHSEFLKISCEEGYQLTGTKRRIYCNEGKWIIDYNPCTKDEVHSNPRLTNISPISTSTTEISRVTTRSASASSKRPLSATPDSLIVGSEDVQKLDDCSCTCAVLESNVLADVKGKRILSGMRVKKGDTATFSCQDPSRILSWPNGLRVRGSVNLPCNTCEVWNERDIPRCFPFYAGDTWIVFNSKMNLLPGGIVQIREREDVSIQCTTLYTQQRQMSNPQWSTSPPKDGFVNYHDGYLGNSIVRSTYLNIRNFNSDLTGRYECYAMDIAGAQYGATILNLEVSYTNQCPEIDEKGSFIINYSNDKKTNSFAHYKCKSNSQIIRGSNIRTCQPNGEWSGSDPVCTDITCQTFRVSGSLNVSYSMGNKAGSIAEFRCKEPAVLIGSFTAKCLLTGAWDNPQPSCDEPEILCPVLDEQDIFIIRYNNYRKVNSNAHYYCRDPDHKISGSNVRKCRENGRWAGVDPECVAPGCPVHSLMESLPQPFVLNDEDITGEIAQPGTEIRLLCENNMVLVGNKKATCNQQGRWSIGNVQCKLGCHLDVNDSPSSLIIEPMKDFYLLGEGALLSCPEGYELTTQVERVMCIGSSWSDPLPSCKEK